ncbi:MAG: PEP-CTERM sorting domain-containing protein [Phycisphaerae bacterium]|jgi:hypothetical protein|nr:PEP-CTERM sorting domain-containing protein [Phycisphaerae bacterium]MCZ2398813.1 PEP-CTERM sorting domain-containing protein [Phycisphaerae bacterium]
MLDHRSVRSFRTRFAAALVGAAATVGVANAQWTVTPLEPAGANQSQGRGVGPGQQVGYSRFTSPSAHWRASLWNGSAASWTDLHPIGQPGAPDNMSSYAMKTDGVQQVGTVSGTGVLSHAALWSGTAASFVNLNPAGATVSFANDVQNGVQVGRAQVAGMYRASLWTGSAASWTDLHPSAYAGGSALSTIDGAQQGGWAFPVSGGPAHAGLWTGTAASFVDLHPPDALPTDISSVQGMHLGQQVGDVGPINGFHAALWTGTAASHIDLNPTGSIESMATAVFNGVQVGYADFSAGSRAGYWTGTADSFVNLHDTLPSGPLWISSIARDVWDDGTTRYIIGYATEFVIPNGAQLQHAFLWTQPVPEPATAALLSMAGLLVLRRRRRQSV